MEAQRKGKNHPTVLISYKGDVTEDLFNCIMQLAEDKLSRFEMSTKTRRKVFRVMVESLQNVYHHFDDLKSGNPLMFPVSFSLKRRKTNYQIKTGNHVLMGKVADLKEFIDDVNKMSPPELKQYYRQQLSHGKISSMGGAKLGMVDIVRKSGEKISYQFQPVNSDYSYFSLNVKIPA